MRANFPLNAVCLLPLYSIYLFMVFLVFFVDVLFLYLFFLYETYISPGNFWTTANKRSFLISFAKKNDFNPFDVLNWYQIKASDIIASKVSTPLPSPLSPLPSPLSLSLPLFSRNAKKYTHNYHQGKGVLVSGSLPMALEETFPELQWNWQNKNL